MRKALSAAALTLALAAAAPAQAAKFKVLDFFGVGGFAHGSRPVANVYLDSLAKVMDFELVKTEDPSVFTAENLATVKVVVLNNNTTLGKILSVEQRSALMAFIRTKGVLAWHSSSDQGGSWPEYVSYLGTEFKSHGAAIGTVRRDPASGPHPVITGLPDTARFDEEWYAFKANPRAAPNIKVLYTLDEASCKNPCSEAMGDHPVVWTRSEPTGGRLFYSAMGHFDHIFQKTAFTKTLYKQALDWAVAAESAPIRPLQGTVRQEGFLLRRLAGTLSISVPGDASGVTTVDGRALLLPR